MSDHNTQTSGGHDWSDPHHFHHGADAQADHEHDGHHVSSWQLLVGILGALVFFTWLTVFLAKQEAWIMLHTGFEFTQLQNVVIAMSIATIKAMLVAMYFMHLKHDNPLNGLTLLVTLGTMSLFLLFPAIDVANRDLVNPFKSVEPSAGGTGQRLLRKDGSSWQGPQTEYIRAKAIETAIADAGNNADEGGWEYWKEYYEHRSHYSHVHLPERHPADTDDYYARWYDEYASHHHTFKGKAISTANQSVPRSGLTAGLFDLEAPEAHHDAHGSGHGDSHGDSHDASYDDAHGDAHSGGDASHESHDAGHDTDEHDSSAHEGETTDHDAPEHESQEHGSEEGHG